jgi:hypothetical protein
LYATAVVLTVLIPLLALLRAIGVDAEDSTGSGDATAHAVGKHYRVDDLNNCGNSWCKLLYCRRMNR